MTPATIVRMPARASAVSVSLTPTQVMVLLEALRMARVETLKAINHLKLIWPESVTHAEQLARYAEQMADTATYLDKVSL